MIISAVEHDFKEFMGSRLIRVLSEIHWEMKESNGQAHYLRREIVLVVAGDRRSAKSSNITLLFVILRNAMGRNGAVRGFPNRRVPLKPGILLGNNQTNQAFQPLGSVN